MRLTSRGAIEVGVRAGCPGLERGGRVGARAVGLFLPTGLWWKWPCTLLACACFMEGSQSFLNQRP